MKTDALLNLSDDRRLRVALIGCGAVAELYHGPALQLLVQSREIEVVVLVDPVGERLGCLAKQFSEARCFSALESSAFSEVDFAIVASPPRWHEEQVLHLLRMGVHVLCEKPMATTLPEAKRMVESARVEKRLLSVGLFRRFFPTSEFIKDLIEGRSLGMVRSVQWSEGGHFNWPAATPSFFSANASGGGVFADVGTHALDLLVWWLGEPSSIDYEDDAMGGLEANGHARLGFGGGQQASLRLSRDTSITNGTRVDFDAGSVWFQGASANTLVLETKGSRWSLKGELHQKSQSSLAGFGGGAPGYHQAFVAQIRNFVNAVKGTEPLKVTAEEALCVHDWIERGYATRRLMKMPWLTDEEIAWAHRLAQGANR